MNCDPVSVALLPVKVNPTVQEPPALIGTGSAVATLLQVPGVPVLKVNGFVVPEKVIVALRTLVFAVPVLLKLTTHVPAEPMHEAVAVTWALDVNDPNRPNTNPAMAMAAMSVIAMRITVAMTGEMAFLPLPYVIFIVSEPFDPLK